MAKTKNWGNWEDADRSDNFSLIISNEGFPGSGRSHFGLTGPEPIAVHLFDPAGLKGLTKKAAFKKRDIKVINYDFNPGRLKEEDRPKAAQEALEKFRENQEVALKNAKTIVWDKEEHVWEMLRYARLEAYTDKPSNYYELNLEYRGWFHDVEMAGVNLCVIRDLKDKWGKTGVSREGKAQMGYTGELEPQGHNKIAGLVQVVLRHRWDSEAKLFVAQIHEKCRVGEDMEDLMGKEFGSPCFKDVGEALFAETEDMDPSPWE
jgi:hypothetical protein